MTLRFVAPALGLLLGWVTYSGAASGQAAPDHERAPLYYEVHGGIVGALLVGSVALHVSYPTTAGADPGWFPGDQSPRGRRSGPAAELSNTLMALTVAAPVFTELGRGANARFANFGIVYGQDVTTNLVLNGISKLTFRRPRPYTYGLPVKDDLDPRERNVSFYSGHTSTAFTAAVAGSLLYAESGPTRTGKLIVWGSDMLLAGATSNLRIRAGKHYYSDVLVGALVGTGIGVLVPVLHGLRYEPDGAEYLVASSGLVLGVVISELLPMQFVKLQEHATNTWNVAPWASGAGMGLTANGAF